MGRRASLARLLVAVLVVAGCDEKKPVSSPSASTTAVSAVSATTSASAEVPAPPDPSPPDPSKSTKWNGTYESKTVTLETPEKVNDFTWKKDDGTKAVGRGQISLSVQDGVVSGDASGPLGPQKLSGMMADKTLRLKLFPADPTSAMAMTGTGVGQLKEGVYSGKLRCAGPKGVVVREVTFNLESVR